MLLRKITICKKRCHVITWEGVPDSPDRDKQTFQAILYQSGDIIFQYKDITGSSTVTSVGIENQ